MTNYQLRITLAAFRVAPIKGAFDATQGLDAIASRRNVVRADARGSRPGAERTLCAAVLLVTFAVGGQPAVAQEAGIELKLPTRVLELGESVDAELECVNTGAPSLPEGIVPDGLDLKLLSSHPSTRTEMQIINGRMTQRESYTWHLRITAMTEGTHTLGKISVTAGGKTYRTQPVQIVVRRTDLDATPKGDRVVYVEMEVEPTSLYVTQTYTARLTIGVRRVQIGGRTFNVDWLRSLARSGSQLSVFADAQWTRSISTLRDSTGMRHAYDLLNAVRQIRAEEVGRVQVGPVFVRIDYPTAVRPGWFGDFEVTQRRRETARADALTVVVLAPPEEGRPESYNGAIGRYTMTVLAKPTRVEQGQPITLSIAISGTPLEGVAAPDPTRYAELSVRFDFSTAEIPGDIEGAAKLFRRAIFPKSAGLQTIPSIEWSFFDPEAERYVTLRSEPVEITVDPAAGVAGRPLTTIEEPAVPLNRTMLRVLTGGLSPNDLDAAAVLADQSFTLTAGWKAALVVPPLLWFVTFVVARRRTRMRTDVHFARRSRARSVALSHVQDALRNGDARAQYAGLAAALNGYLADRYGLPSASLTPAEARSLLSQNGVGGSLAEKVASFLETCDALRYAPGAAGDLSPDEAAQQVREWIRRIEKAGD